MSAVAESLQKQIEVAAGDLLRGFERAAAREGGQPPEELPLLRRQELVAPADRRAFCLQAEDGIRDATVTGVQPCALPIWLEKTRWPTASSPAGSSRRCWPSSGS